MTLNFFDGIIATILSIAAGIVIWFLINACIDDKIDHAIEQHKLRSGK